MKKRYTCSDEPKKIWEAVFKKARKSGGIYLQSEKDFIFHSYESLISDSLGAAALLTEIASQSDPITISAGAYDTSVIILAASISSRQVIISDERDEMSFRGLIITDKRSFSPKFISDEELHVLIKAYLSGISAPKIKCSKEEISITFRSGGESITYSESSALLSAIAFKTGIGLSSKDLVLSTFSPSTESGFLCGILAPLISSSSLFVCNSPELIIRHAKSLSPTKLFCSRRTATALILKLLRIKKLHPRRQKSKFSLSIDPYFIFLHRLSHPRISYMLGGRLKTVITSGELSAVTAKAFFSFGIYSISFRSVKGVSPSMFHYGEDSRGFWRLPSGVSADLCNLQKGGIGSIVISSPYVREGEHIPDTYLPHEKLSPSSLVTPLCGFVTQKGRIFVAEE